jgi:diadenosine tetraphosphatase ApaH/serine/threonine PP2A family protein phosphatase
MRALILSDIHSNLEALEAVLSAAPEHDVVWNLGDVVGYGASPNEVADQVQRLGGIVVRGNHDRACSGLIGVDEFSQYAADAALWTRQILSNRNSEWLRGLPPGPFDPNNSAVRCVHGSLADEDEYLFTVEDALPSLRQTISWITFFGHTHRQGGFATNGEDYFQLKPHYGSPSEIEQYELPLRDGARYLLNPGSVGQPRDRDRRAAFAVYDDAQSLVTWYRAPYDIQRAQQRIREANLPEYLGFRLQHGE